MSINVVDLSGNAPYVPPLGSVTSPAGAKLLETLTTNTNTTPITIGGKFNVTGTGSFDSGTISIQREIDGTWVTCARDSANNLAQYTSNFTLAIAEPQTLRYRAVLSGAGGSASIRIVFHTTPRDAYGSA